MKRLTDNQMYCRVMAMISLLPSHGELPDDERRKLRNERKRARKARRNGARELAWTVRVVQPVQPSRVSV